MVKIFDYLLPLKICTMLVLIELAWWLVFANGPGDLGSIPGRVIPKTQKMVLDASLLNTQHYKVRIQGKVEKSRQRSSTENGAFECGRQLYFLLW